VTPEPRAGISTPSSSRQVRRSAAWPCLTVLLVLSMSAKGEAASQAGVIVETVRGSFSIHRAGIQPGDVIVSWRREASPPANPTEAHGEIRSWFDLIEVEYEQSARGKLRLSGSRAGVPFDVVVPPGRWNVEVRPVSMPRDLVRLYDAASRKVEDGEFKQGAALWRQAALQAEKQSRWELAAWLHARIGAAGSHEEAWGDVDAAYQASA
jgi:hypothetical protein